MNQSVFTNDEFRSIEIAHNLTSVTMKAWDSCAHIEVSNPAYIVTLISSGGQSAHLYEYDCFECLSPHKIAA